MAGLDMVANEGIHVAGMHFNMPGFGHVRQGTKRFELLKSEWSPVVV
ncbi:hypothetical protein ACU8MI_16160 [Rhizobium leguminosarum]